VHNGKGIEENLFMLDKELELTLNAAFKDAREKRYEFMTVEHLLLALLDNTSASTVLRACGANLNALHNDLIKFITENSPILGKNDDRDTQPTLGFQRVLQRAVFHVQSSGRKEVNGANVLVAIFAERESHAAYFLSQQDITRLDVVNYISHGITKIPEDDQNDIPDQAADEDLRVDEAGTNPLEAYAVNLNALATQGKIDPLIGRQLEVERTIQILCRRRKNNPLYVGEAGVGKTAIGGGFALATGFIESGLSVWFGHQLSFISGIHPIFIIAFIAFMITFLTELTSNTATTEMMLPILAGLSVGVEINPLLFMIPATLAASMAFMLPVATPPNAIIFDNNKSISQCLNFPLH